MCIRDSNTSPEPFSNWAASFAEDFAVVGGLLVAVNHPLVFLVLLVLFILLLIWLLPKLWRGIKRVFSALGRLFGARPAAPPPPPPPPQPPAGPPAGPPRLERPKGED